jgi:hypothetical protein
MAGFGFGFCWIGDALGNEPATIVLHGCPLSLKFDLIK